MKKGILITAGVVVLIILAAMIILPWLYKERIAGWIEAEANKNLNAEISFDHNVGISLIRNFPNLSVRIDDLVVANKEPFQEDTLFKADRTRATINLMSLFRGDEIRVSRIALDKPIVHVHVLEDGRGNWDIMLPAEETDEEITEESEEFEFSMALQKYSLNDATVIYDDKLFAFYLNMEGVDHTGSGDFTQDIFNLSTHTYARDVNMSFDGMPLLSQVNAELDADLEMDLNDFRFTFLDNMLKLNELMVEVDGFVGLPDVGVDMDIDFHAADTRVEHLLSIIPGIYTEDFDLVESSGEMQFGGMVKGNFSDTSMPAHEFTMGIADGSFYHPDMPESLDELNLDFRSHSDDGDLDNTVVNLSNLSFAAGGNPFRLRFLLETPMSDPYVDAVGNGSINLAVIAPFVPFEGEGRMEGILNTDFRINGNYSTIEAENYEAFDASGNISLRDFVFEDRGNFDETLTIADMRMAISPQEIDLSNINMGFGDSDFEATGKLEYFLGYMLNGFEIDGRHSDPYVEFEGNTNLNLSTFRPFMPLEDDVVMEGSVIGDLILITNLSSIEEERYSEVAFEGNVNMTDFRYEDPELPEDVAIDELAMDVTPEQFNLSTLQMRLGESDLLIDGYVSNFLDHALNGGLLEGSMSMYSNRLNLNPWMESDEEVEQPDEETEEDWELELIEIPENLSLAFDAELEQVLFGDWDIRDMQGMLDVSGGRLTINDAGLSLFDGRFALDGFYEANDGVGDVFFDLDVSDVDIPLAYESLEIVERFAPVAKYANGTFGGTMDYQSRLNNDFSPVLNSINSEGQLDLRNVGLEEFEMLNKLADRMQMDRLKTLQIEEFRPSYSIYEGRFNLEPANFKAWDYEFALSGFNLLDGSIDYDMDIAMPGAHFQDQAGGALSQIAGRDISLKQDHDIVFNVNFTGKYDDPDVSVSLKDMLPSSPQDILDRQKERAREELRDYEERGREEVDDARERARDEIEQRRREVEQRAREREEKVRDSIDKQKERAREEIDEKKEEGKDRFRDEIKDRSPW